VSGFRFSHTVPCVRPATVATTDDFGNPIGEDRPQASFDGAFFPPSSLSGSQIVDGVLRVATVTKPSVFVDGRPDVRSGDALSVDGDPWVVDGDPAAWVNPFNGWQAPMVIELRRTVG